MKTFNFYKDQKCTIWERAKFEIEAETYEQAVQIVKEMEENPSMYDEIETRWEFLYETNEQITPEQNGYEATIEIFSDDTNETIFTNNPRLPQTK